MAERKTNRTDDSVDAFLARVPDETRRQDCLTVLALMKQATKAEPKMWGPSIVGFGASSYTTADGRDHEWFLIGFSPRKQDLTLYIRLGSFDHAALLARLGTHTTGKGCLYIKRLANVDVKILKQLIVASVKQAKRNA